jgi:flagellar basal-body rod modification protein FlgD
MSTGINATPNIDQNAYMQLFMQELTYQDPLKPMDNREFMAQMAQFSSLQEAHETNEQLGDLLTLTRNNQHLMMLGKQVKINGSSDIGKVMQIVFQEGIPPQLIIDMNGAQLTQQLSNISSVMGEFA